MWRWRSASDVGFRLRDWAEVEFVLVVSGDQVVLQLGFTVCDLRHEIVVLGLTLQVYGPVDVGGMSGVVQSIPWGRGWIGLGGRRGQRWRPPARVAEAPAGPPDG